MHRRKRDWRAAVRGAGRAWRSAPAGRLRACAGSLAGLALLTAAVYSWAGLAAGLAAGGVSCFVAEWRVRGEG